MKLYQVGGCVRDELLGEPAHDVDWLVVGSTPAEMTALGYRQVGADFPVFLHPKSQDEYALARIERKTAAGHKGFETRFDSSVTVEEDLSRRDLTINAMAKDMATGEIVDPFGGRRDLAEKVLRHVSNAFSEDPLRVLRLARFQARTGFVIHPKTAELCTSLCAGGALRELSAERVCSEMRKLLACASPVLGLQSLLSFGALESLDPAWPDRLAGPQLDAIDKAAKARLPEWAMARLCFCPGMDAKASARFLEGLRFPSDMIKWSARIGGFCQWATQGLGRSPIDFDEAAQAAERAGLARHTDQERTAFKVCVLLELESHGAGRDLLALAEALVDASPSIATADLSTALASPPSELPSAVRCAKAQALRSAWDQTTPSRRPRA